MIIGFVMNEMAGVCPGAPSALSPYTANTNCLHALTPVYVLILSRYRSWAYLQDKVGENLVGHGE